MRIGRSSASEPFDRSHTTFQHFHIFSDELTMPFSFPSIACFRICWIPCCSYVSIYPNGDYIEVRLLCKGGFHSFTTPSECYNLVYKDHAWMHLVQIVYGGCTCFWLPRLQYSAKMRWGVMWWRLQLGLSLLPHSGGKRDDVSGCRWIIANFVIHSFFLSRFCHQKNPKNPKKNPKTTHTRKNKQTKNNNPKTISPPLTLRLLCPVVGQSLFC